MISVTKIFRFEMGHAISEYEGMCRFIHGHSYVLHVTVATKERVKQPFAPPGFIIDFKELKRIVHEKVVHRLDHALVLSERYIQAHPGAGGENQNLIVWPYEPSAENILYFIRESLNAALPDKYKLQKLQLWETAESYAAWEDSKE